jgi:DNA-binding CsgD family transcriptional regulator
LNRDLLDALLRAREATTDEDLVKAIGKHLSHYDIHMFTSLAAVSKPDGESEIAWLTNCEPAWFEEYTKAGYDRHDYGLRKHFVDHDPRSVVTGRAYAGEHSDMTEGERHFWNVAYENGLVTGLTLPRTSWVAGQEVATGYSIWTGLERSDFEKLMHREGRHLISFLLCVEQTLKRVHLKRALKLGDLTCREADCLRYLANGLTAEGVAEKLMISTPTVRFHLRGAKKKLSANNLYEAVAKAVALGLLDT